MSGALSADYIIYGVQGTAWLEDDDAPREADSPYGHAKANLLPESELVLFGNQGRRDFDSVGYARSGSDSLLTEVELWSDDTDSLILVGGVRSANTLPLYLSDDWRPVLGLYWARHIRKGRLLDDFILRMEHEMAEDFTDHMPNISFFGQLDDDVYYQIGAPRGAIIWQDDRDLSMSVGYDLQKLSLGSRAVYRIGQKFLMYHEVEYDIDDKKLSAGLGLKYGDNVEE